MDKPVIVFMGSNDPQENAVPELIRSHAAPRLLRIEAQRKSSAQRDVDIEVVRVDRLDQLYCMLVTTQHPCCVEVPPQSSGATLAFLEEHPGTANDFGCIICTVSPITESQQYAAETITRLVDMGVDCTKIRVVFTQAPHAVPVRDTFAQLVGHLSNPRFEAISLDVVLYVSPAFERVRDLQLSISRILRGTVDFQAELAHAREAGESDQVVHALARKLLGQRAILGCEDNINQALEALRLPRVAQEDWLRATSDTSALTPQPTVNPENSLTSAVVSGLESEPLPD
jgi:hypothetical protein